jgi:hypothetical protein
MKKKSCFYILIIFILSNISCKRVRVDNKSFIVEKDSNGNLISEINFLNDTIKHGLAKYYYNPIPANILEEEIEYNHGMMEGLYKHYRKDGTLESKTEFKNNIVDGENYWYYENGKTRNESYWEKGKQYGGAKWYYSNGQLKSYIVLDYFGKHFYSIMWDSTGNKIKEDGEVFSKNFIAIYSNDTSQTPIIENSVMKNKNVITRITAAQPPQTKTVIRMGELNKNNMVELKINKFSADYVSLFPKSGKFNLVTVGVMKDLKGNTLKYDSIVTRIVVK